MPTPSQTPYLGLNLDGDESVNRNWALLDDRLLKLALKIVQDALAPGSITQAMLAKPSVGTPEIFDSSITSAKIADGTITRADLDPTMPLPPTPTTPGDVGKVPVVQANGTLAWVAPITPAFTAGDANRVLTVNPTGTAAIWAAAPPATLTPGQVTTLYLADSPNGVTDAKITSVAWAKITGAPGSFPPSGAAGGDLTGSYPNPTIGLLKVDDSKIASVAYSKVTGTPSSLPPSGTAGGDLAGTYPNPTIKAGVIPTALPPTGTASGDLGGSYPSPTVLKASGTFTLSQDPAAALQAATKQYVDARALWTDSGTVLTPATTTRQVTVPGPTGAGTTTALTLGSQTQKTRLEASNPGAGTGAYVALGLNRNAAGTVDDATKPAWQLLMHNNTDLFSIARTPAGGAETPVLSISNAGITTLTLAGSSVTRAMLASYAANAQAVAIPTTFTVTGSPNAYNTWIKVVDFPAITTKGNRVHLSAGPGLLYNAVANGACAVGQLFRRSGTDVAGSGAWTTIGVAGVAPLPTLQAQDQPAAGTYTYSYWVYLANTTTGSITVNSNGAAWCWATEIV